MRALVAHACVMEAIFKYKAEVGDPGYPTASVNKYLPAGGGVYRPENIAVHAAPPVVVNPSNYTLVN